MFKAFGDQTILARIPDMTGHTPTEGQQAAQDRFRQAALYGKMVMADPATKAIYEEAAKEKGQPVFSMTVADFFNAPSVDEVDLSAYGGKVGDCIEVRASDDFAVTGVTVAIANTSGQTLEEGAATETPPASGHWTYTATQAVPTGTAVKITVTAKDRPGHAGQKEAQKS